MFSYKKVFFRSFIINFLAMGSLLIIYILIDKRFANIKITKLNWAYPIIFGIVSTIVNTLKYGIKTEIVSISDRENFIVSLKQILTKFNWKIIKEEGDSFIVKPNFSNALLCEKIIIKVSTNQVELIGAKTLIEKIIWYVQNS